MGIRVKSNSVDVENGARLERKRPADRRPDLNHINLVSDVILNRIAANLQITKAKPDIIKVADPIEATKIDTEIAIVVSNNPLELISVMVKCGMMFASFKTDGINYS